MPASRVRDRLEQGAQALLVVRRVHAHVELREVDAEELDAAASSVAASAASRLR